MSKFRFYITTTSGTTQLDASYISSVKIRYVKQDLFKSFKRELSDELRFRGADFNLLYAIETDVNNCQDIALDIQKLCGSIYSSVFKGNISLKDCVWNVGECEVLVKVKPNDVHYCLLDTWKTEKNIFELAPSNSTVGYQIGVIETITSSTDGFTSNPIDDSDKPRNANGLSSAIAGITYLDVLPEAWTVVRNTITNIVSIGGGNYNFNFSLRTEWKRQRVNNYPNIAGTPFGSGWVNIGAGTVGTTNWARAISKAIDNDNSSGNYSNPLSGDIIEVYTIPAAQSETQFAELDNGMLLNSIIEAFALPCGYNVISNFLGINNDATNPTNTAYTTALQVYQNIFIYQKSDIKRPYDLNNAIKGIITFEKLLLAINAMFELYFSIEGTDLRIEHISYFDNVNGLDLTTNPNYATWLKSANGYSYKTNELPKSEKWQFMETTDSLAGTFDYYPILYSSNCANGEERIRTMQDITTNIEYVSNSATNGAISDLGFCLIATFNYLGRDYIFSDVKANDILGLKYLYQNILSWNRPLISATINDLPVTFNSAKKIRTQKAITVPFCCTDEAIFDPAKNINAEFGWGVLDSAEYDTVKGFITLNLLV
ncbi:MAG: hypothetical protein U5L45_00425 [Saprospiraceae bacterium]|nr:hypothetical protein [Saprospiraceae bacterium]